VEGFCRNSLLNVKRAGRAVEFPPDAEGA
jgi:hypothetical protein